MTPREKISIIARSCGWRLRWQNMGGAPLLDEKPKGHCWEVWNKPDGCAVDNGWDPIFPPNYLNDLNAMREVLAALDDSEMPIYVLHLCRILNFSEEEDWTEHDIFQFSQASASECADAYLRTKNLLQ